MDEPGGAVTITLSMRRAGEAKMVELVFARDDAVSFGGPAIVGPAPVGIRTDFMDVVFDNIRIAELSDTCPPSDTQ